MSNRRAFGLIELLVVVAIIAILIGLLVPAVQKVRESAARLQTNNNLHQIGIAVHAYHDTYRKFPDAFAPGGNFKEPKTLWFNLLPYVEQNNVFTNDSADTSVVPPYLAPSDPYNADPKGTLNFCGNIRLFGYKNYGPQACNDVGKAMKVQDAKTPILSGLKIQQIADGTTNTLMFSTRYSSCNRTEKGEPIRTMINGDPGTVHGGFFGASAVSDPASPLYAATPTITYQIAPKDFDDRAVGQSTKCINNASGVPHSFGRGGVSVALCDGSVRNIVPGMTAQTFARATSPSDGNPLGDEWNDD